MCPLYAFAARYDGIAPPSRKAKPNVPKPRIGASTAAIAIGQPQPFRPPHEHSSSPEAPAFIAAAAGALIICPVPASLCRWAGRT